MTGAVSDPSVLPVDIAYFDGLYAEAADPWALRTRWYEARKRAQILAALPARRYRRAFEPGCGGGDLTQMLSARCDAVLAMDLHSRAVGQVRKQLAQHPHVSVLQGMLPQDWPEGRFDLIVMCELGYYFGQDSWTDVAARIDSALAPDGTLIACHWLHPFDARRQSTESVHDTLADAAVLHRQVAHRERDFILDVWTRQPTSVAQGEGLG